MVVRKIYCNPSDILSCGFSKNVFILSSSSSDISRSKAF